MQHSGLAKVFLAQVVVALALAAALGVTPAKASQAECTNLPGSGYRGRCQTEGGISPCISDGSHYCIFGQISGECFTGTCTGGN